MRERYIKHGWNITDDDTPKVLDCDSLSSPQHRRWVKSMEQSKISEKAEIAN